MMSKIALICAWCGTPLRDGHVSAVSHGICGNCEIEERRKEEPDLVVAVARFERSADDLVAPCAIWINDEPVVSGYWREDA